MATFERREWGDAQAWPKLFNAIARLAEIGQLWRHPGAAPRVDVPLLISTPDLAYAQPAFASSIRDR
jgi:hypothetical protein